MVSEAQATLAEILSMVLERPIAPDEMIVRAEEAKWDSLKHLEIVMAVEAAFGVTFSSDEMAEIAGSQDIARKLAAGG